MPQNLDLRKSHFEQFSDVERELGDGGPPYLMKCLLAGAQLQ